MALFKILSNMDDTSKSLPSNYVKGYCYFNVNDGKFWVDTSNAASGRIALNAVKADELTTSAGSTTLPVYFQNGKPVATSTSLAVSITGNAATATKLQTASAGGVATPVYWVDGKPTKLTATVGSTKTPVYLNAGVITECTELSTVGLTHIGDAEPASEDYVLWVDTDEPDVTIGYEIYTGPSEPTEESYDLWIDTSLETKTAMASDAIKYKTFSIATDDWTGSGPYTWSVDASGITENTAIINLTLDATSQTYQKAQLDWETGADTITLSTATKPTGTISGYLIAAEVTVI